MFFSVSLIAIKKYLVFLSCTMSLLWALIRDRIKGLILRCINAYCGAATIHEVPQYMKCCSTQDSSLSFVYCGSCTAAAMNLKVSRRSTQDELYIPAAVHKPQYTRDKRVSCVLRHLVYCGGRSLPWQLKFSLPQRRNLSSFIRSPLIHCTFYQ